MNRLSSTTENDTNTCMKSDSRDRLVHAASRLFARDGFRGASVRDICNLAGTNPGAVSYHFGGKRQLYRHTLRRAATRIETLTRLPEGHDDSSTPIAGVYDGARRTFEGIAADETAARLLLRDLADGGSVAVEALTTPLRAAVDRMSSALGHGEETRGSSETRQLFLEIAASLFLVAAGWPVVARVLELDDSDRRAIVEELLLGVARRHGP